MHNYGLGARILRKGYQLFHQNWVVVSCQDFSGPRVYCVQHNNFFGPFHTLGLLPGEPLVWALHIFLERESCFDQYYGYTFTQRYHWPKPLAYVVAKLLSWVVPPVLRSFRCIPVFRDACAVATIRQTVDALVEGKSVLLFPDVEYTKKNSGIEEIYLGFLNIERAYHSKTGKHLPFVPLHCAKKDKCVVVGEAVCFTGHMDFRRERPLVADKLVHRLNSMAAQSLQVPFDPAAEGNVCIIP